MKDKNQKPLKVYAISLLGRVLRDSYGNTYHTARIMVNGAYVYGTPITYGTDVKVKISCYERHYEETAKKWLAENSYIPLGSLSTSLRRYCDDKGIGFDSVSVDVQSKKEL